MSSDTRTRIMLAARELFSQHGYAAVSTKEIASKANTSEVTLFRHFENKRNLFNAIVKEQMHSSEIADYIKNEATYDVRHDLSVIARKMFENSIKNSDFIKMIIKDALMNSDAVKQNKIKENKEKEALHEYFHAIKEKGLIFNDEKKLMRFFVSNIHGHTLKNYILTEHNKCHDDEEYFDWLVYKIIDTILLKNKNNKENI